MDGTNNNSRVYPGNQQQTHNSKEQHVTLFKIEVDKIDKSIDYEEGMDDGVPDEFEDYGKESSETSFS